MILCPERSDSVRQIENHPVLPDVLFQKHGHFPVKGRHHLIQRFHNRDLQAFPPQILCCLQSDKSAAHHNSSFISAVRDHTAYLFRIRNCPQRKNPFRIHPRNPGAQRRRACCNDQFVIALLICPVRRQIGHPNLLLFPVNRRYFIPGSYIYPESLLKDLFLCHQKRIFRFDHIPDIVRQSAVCVGNIWSSFQKYDLRALIQPAQAGSAACARRHSSDNHSLSHP